MGKNPRIQIFPHPFLSYLYDLFKKSNSMKKLITSFFISIFLFTFSAKAQLSIATDSILQLSTCAGGNIIVPYTVSGGNYNFGNVFTAQLSDNWGSFANPVNIGSLFYWSSGIIFCTIPVNTNFGFFYRIRILSSNPVDTSSESPNTLIITQIAQLNDIFPNPGDSICDGETVTLTAINLAASYVWSTGDTTASITVDSSGIYTVTTTDFLGCESTTSDTVVVLPCLGFQENDFESALSIYPNPASTNLNFKWNVSGTEYLNIHLYNSTGAEILRAEKIKVNSVTENRIDISGLSSGIYLIAIDSGERRVVKKIVVE